MTKRGVAKALAALTAAYQRELTDATIALYVNHLGDVNDDLLLRAANESIIRSKFFPSIAELRERCAIILLGDGIPPLAELAWAEVMKAVTTHGRNHRPHFSHPLILKTLENIGGYYEVCMTTQADMMRMRFCRLYDQERMLTISAVAVSRYLGDGTQKALGQEDIAQLDHASQQRHATP